MHALLEYVPTLIDSGLGALGIGLVIKLRHLVDSVVKTQTLMLDRLESMDQRLKTTERHVAVRAAA